jgi:oligopeptidase B
MLMRKKNTFTDFVDCADWLVKNPSSAPDRLVIEGGSAGGLLMGAVVNLRPDLFRAVHLSVPFVDMYWESAQYVATLRTLKTDARPLLLKCNMGAGHGGAGGRYDRLKEVSFEYAWLMTQVGITRWRHSKSRHSCSTARVVEENRWWLQSTDHQT